LLNTVGAARGLVAGQTYRASAWVKVLTPLRVTADVEISNGGAGLAKSFLSANTTDWQLLTTSAMAPSPPSLTLFLRFSGMGGMQLEPTDCIEVDQIWLGPE
jgi:hypothetical protein